MATTRSTEAVGIARFARAIAIVAGVFFAAGGLWAMAAPRSFFTSAATFEPYNQHFIQDIGAFQIGLAAVLLIAAWRPSADALAVALLGVGVGSIAHTVSHIIGRDLGGSPVGDITRFSVITVVLLVAGLARWRGR